MCSQELKNAVCRVCLDGDVVLDWSNTLDVNHEITFENCYFKYTQLNSDDADVFSSMLCQNCINGLQNMHLLVLKAIDSYNFFREIISGDEIHNSEYQTSITTQSEMVLAERRDTVSELDELFDLFNDSDEEWFDLSNDPDKEWFAHKSVKVKHQKENTYDGVEEKISESFKQYPEDNRFELKGKHLLGNKINDSKQIQKTKLNKKTDPYMCSICSRVLSSKLALKRHEQTHLEYRERKEECSICGLKFFDRTSLLAHLRIHDEKRKKKHKCEFCDKEFYAKGGLNVHRRIHLGQMLPCTLCSKEYCRQIDLDVHMLTHEEVPISSNAKKRTKYFVTCLKCGQEVRSSNYKSHMAVHLNTPLMKCLVCGKGFFIRDSCTTHVREVHKKSREEYNKFIEILNNTRLSHLLLAQTAGVKPNNEV